MQTLCAGRKIPQEDTLQNQRVSGCLKHKVDGLSKDAPHCKAQALSGHEDGGGGGDTLGQGVWVGGAAADVEGDARQVQPQLLCHRQQVCVLKTYLTLVFVYDG